MTATMSFQNFALDGLLSEQNQKDSEPPAYCDSYFYDDLLVTTTREIITNGLKTPNVPRSIKDWIFGKVMESLPEQLVKRLIKFVLDNRNENKVAYKENAMGDEFTILVYRTERQFKNREKKLIEEMEERMAMDNNEFQKFFDKENDQTIDVKDNGMEYHAPEIICEEGNRVIYREALDSVVAKQVENLTAGILPENMSSADLKREIKNKMSNDKDSTVSSPVTNGSLG